MSTATERSRELLRRTPDHKRIAMPDLPQLQLDSLGPAAERIPALPFSVFLPLHQERALEIVEEMMKIAKEQGLDAAVARAERAAEEESVELAQYALMIFIISDPQAKQIPIEPLQVRQPQ